MDKSRLEHTRFCVFIPLIHTKHPRPLEQQTGYKIPTLAGPFYPAFMNHKIDPLFLSGLGNVKRKNCTRWKSLLRCHLESSSLLGTCYASLEIDLYRECFRPEYWHKSLMSRLQKQLLLEAIWSRYGCAYIIYTHIHVCICV